MTSSSFCSLERADMVTRKEGVMDLEKKGAVNQFKPRDARGRHTRLYSSPPEGVDLCLFVGRCVRMGCGQSVRQSVKACMMGKRETDGRRRH